MEQKNRLKCKWCEWTTPRWRGPGKPGTAVLYRHVVERHEDEVRQVLGIASDLKAYEDMLEEEEGRRFGDIGVIL